MAAVAARVTAGAYWWKVPPLSEKHSIEALQNPTWVANLTQNLVQDSSSEI